MKKDFKKLLKWIVLCVVCSLGIVFITNRADAAKVTVAKVKNLKVKSITETSGKLYWSKVSKAKGYIVYEYDRAKKKYSKKIATTSKTNYTVKKLKTGTNHLYKVVAYRKVGKKTYKGKMSDKVRLVTKPKKVTTLKKSTIRKDYIKLKWSKPAGADGYAVYKYNTSKKKYEKVGATTKTNYTVKGLKDATKYQFRVKSYAKADKTYSYAAVSNTVTTYTKPNIVTNFYQTESKSQNSITFTWSKARAAYAYRVYRLNASNNTWKYLKQVSNTTTKYTDTNLSAGASYKYMVRTIILDENKKNLFDWEYTVREMITTPAAVGTLVVNGAGVTDTSIPLTWSSVSGANGYYVERYNESTKAYVRLGKTTSTSYTDKGLTGFTTYKYRVIPYKTYSFNKKEYASVATAKTVSAQTKLGTPTNLRVTNKTDNSVEVSWDKVPKATGYNIYVYDEGKLIKQDKTVNTKYVYALDAAGVIAVNIKIEAYYAEAVASSPGNVSGSGSNPSGGTTTNNVVGAATAIDVSNIVDKVTGVTRSAYSTSTIGLTWSKQEGILKYEIFSKTTGGYTKIGESTSNSYLVSGLAAGSYYSYAVRAVEIYEGRTIYGEYSDVVTLLTMHGAPTVKVSHTDVKKLKVTWNKLPNADYYQVFRLNTSTNTYVHIATTTSGVVSYTDTNVSMGTKYSYKVRAYTKYNSLDYYGTFSSVSTRRLGQYGIDVSKWQADINWSKVKAAGVDYAIIRAGYGGSSFTLDTKYKANMNGAIAAGIDVGVYIYSYADTVAEAKKEANALIPYLKSYKLTYPVYFDVEEEEIGSRLSKAELTNITIAFCETIKAAGYTPGVYSGASYYSTNLNYNDIAQYEIWIARYVKTDTYKYPSQMTAINNYLKLTYQYGGKYTSINAGMWQYTSTGRVDGISGNVDMNISYKTY